jgi:hypothetical protein
MSDKTVVLAIFNDEVAADSAAASLKDTGAAQSDAIGILVADENGKLKTEKVGKRSAGKGAGIGAVLALCTPVGVGAGLIGGGLLGALHQKSLGLDQTDRDRIGGELAGARAAVGVLAPISEASYVAASRKLMSSPTRPSRKPGMAAPQANPRREGGEPVTETADRAAAGRGFARAAGDMRPEPIFTGTKGTAVRRTPADPPGASARQESTGPG